VVGGRRRHIGIELTLAGLSGVLFALTLVWPDWIEAAFGVDPDGGNGALEFLVAAVFLAVALALGRHVARELRTN
jgi:hypothetical protein